MLFLLIPLFLSFILKKKKNHLIFSRENLLPQLSWLKKKKKIFS